MKLPNGYGSVYNLCKKSKSGNPVKKRRKPWAAYVTTSVTYDAESMKARQKRRLIGTYTTKDEALEALAAYRANPYDLDADKITFQDVYEKWSEEYFSQITPSACRSVTSAYARFTPLLQMRFAEIRVSHLEGCIKDADASDNTKMRMKSVLNLMYKYALRHEIVQVDYASMCLGIKKPKPQIKRIPFSAEEIQQLWDHLEYPFTDMVIIGIYTGWRPQELSELRLANVDLDNKTMTGGMKTDAGIDRIVPIHSRIFELVRANYEKAEKLGSEYLFNDPSGQQGSYLTYDKYRGRFKKVMLQIGADHKPHDTRHTFITLAKEAGCDEYSLKRIVGHAIRDVTEVVYTHRDIEKLRNEIEKIK